jgi:cellulose synthase/poly-beta-1,6-N-acetylglucosamine synthase-like glycosyltransferase
MTWIVIALVALLVIVDILLILLWLFNFKTDNKTVSDEPLVSIFVAARNEENNIADCLKSLLNIDYPAGKLEILIGDDASTDGTAEIVQAFAAKNKHIHLFKIDRQITRGNGKANVLAHLAHEARGDYFLVTDADIVVPQRWVKAMLSGLGNDVGLVTGTSIVSGNNNLAKIQRIDWLHATGMLKVVSDIQVPVTTMGNNMLVTRKAYEAVGGYEAMPFSVTEDLELFNHVKKKFKTVNLFNPDVLNRSKPQDSIGALLQQRKRWMRGAFELPVLMILILLLQSSFILFFLVLLVFNPVIAFAALMVKFLLRFLFVSLVGTKLEEKVDIISSFVFELFNIVFSFVSVLYYFLSGPIVWKERKY